MAVNWHDDDSARFADFEAADEMASRERRRTRKLEDRVAELEAQLRSVLHILEANGLSGDEELGN